MKVCATGDGIRNIPIPVIMEGMKRGYDKLFRELLPRKVAELDPDRFYMHGSPYEPIGDVRKVGRLPTAIIGVSGMVRNRLKSGYGNSAFYE